ncbi:MAG: NAD(P)H-dependent oxidoreductase subunit E [Phycisphaerae bacterium]|nr:NAD(P)H-dependent oxidoreductase subunit E [Phycisphaerae bacterium]
MPSEELTSVEEIDVSAARRIAAGHRAQGNSLVTVLQDVQTEYGYLSPEVLEVVAQEMDVPFSQAYGLATFYSSFSLQPRGKHHVCVCMGTACHVRGAANILEKLERDLGIKTGQTSDDLQHSLESVNCLGACALGPVVVVNDTYHGKVTSRDVDKILGDLD